MISVRFARFATGIILNVDGRDRWIEPDELEEFIEKAKVVIAKAREEKS